MNETTPGSIELGPIRPPSEAYSLLIRVTRNCSWNRCHFCHTFKGQKFELRTVEAIKQDILAIRAIQDTIKELSQQASFGGRVESAAAAILNQPPSEAFFNVAFWLYYGGTNAFLQDANTLIMKTPDLVEVIKFLKQTLPSITRVTSYGRSKTAAKKTLAELGQLHEAGLTRLHVGMESGSDHVLQDMDKGVTAAEHIAGGQKVVASGISLCEYVLLGLGGKALWREHATETARVLNEIEPEFIRVRTMTVKAGMPLYDRVREGSFVRANDEEVIEEEKLLIQNLNCRAQLISDHITNLLQELEGQLPQDKERLLGIIDRFQSLSPEARLNFRLGRRLGIYERLDDMSVTARHDMVEESITRLNQEGRQVDDDIIFSLMERFI